MKKRVLSLFLAAVFAFCSAPTVVFADELEQEETYSYSLKATNLQNGKCFVMKDYTDYDIGGCIELTYSANEDSQITVTSSDPEVVSVKNNSKISVWRGNNGYCSSYFTAKKYGCSVLSYKLNNKVLLKVPVLVYKINCEIRDFSSKQNGKVAVKWRTVENVDGYVIWKAKPRGKKEKDYTPKWIKAAVVKGGKTRRGVVGSKWGKHMYYAVSTCVKYNGKYIVCPPDDIYYYSEYTTEKEGAQISSVKQAGKNALKISWKSVGKNSKYILYRSKLPNEGYKKIKKVKAGKGKTVSVKDKVSAGEVYYYKIVSVFNGATSNPSNAASYIIPNRKKEKITHADKLKISDSKYNGDTCYAYKSGKYLYFASYIDNALWINRCNKNAKLLSSRKIKLPSHDDWGGFYHAPDGYNYVVLGYDNPKDSKKKTVIKVIKFSPKYKKLKTAVIKGGASNSFDGIHSPFRAGNVSIDSQGDTLYVFTSRLMFKVDGVWHQSNIGFEVNTKKMTAKTSNLSYVSHSFDQYARFCDGGLYLSDLGDAYPRAIQITWTNNYTGKNSRTYSSVPFKFKGEIGDNYTGCLLGGLEVGKTNIICAGSSVPHKNKIKGATGMDGNRNLFVTLTDRKTGKSKFKWLTSISPKKGNHSVELARLVKITDNRFAILYNIENTDTGNMAFRIMTIDNNGNIIKDKAYKKIDFSMYMQPIIFNGYLTFVNPYYTIYDSKQHNDIYRIPV